MFYLTVTFTVRSLFAPSAVGLAFCVPTPHELMIAIASENASGLIVVVSTSGASGSSVGQVERGARQF